jgi:hypothetical protein
MENKCKTCAYYCNGCGMKRSDMGMFCNEYKSINSKERQVVELEYEKCFGCGKDMICFNSHNDLFTRTEFYRCIECNADKRVVYCLVSKKPKKILWSKNDEKQPEN